MLNVACFVQSCLTDADFVIFSNYCLIGTRLMRGLSFFDKIIKQMLHFLETRVIMSSEKQGNTANTNGRKKGVRHDGKAFQDAKAGL